MSSHAASGPVQRRPGEQQRGQLAALVLHRGGTGAHRRQPARVAAVQPDGERRPRPRLAAGLLDQRLAADPAGDQVHLGRGVVGQQRRLELVVARPARRARRRRSSAGGWWPARAARSPSPPSAAEPLLAVAAGGDLAQHGVDQPGGAGADDAAGEVDGRVDGGVRRHPQVDQLVGAQPEQVEHPRVELGQRPGHQAGQDGVQRALRAQRAVGELGGEGGVALLQLPLAQQLREQQVGVRGRARRRRPARRRRSAARRRAPAGGWPDAGAVPSGRASAGAPSLAHPLPELRAARRGPSRRRGTSACRPAARRRAGRRPRPVPTSTPVGPDLELAGGHQVDLGQRLHRAEPQPLAAPRRPGARRGGDPADPPVDDVGGQRPVDLRIGGLDPSARG